MGRYLDLLRQREMKSQTLIRKGRVYINPGKTPPAGKKIKQGTRGKYYYETDGRTSSKPRKKQNSGPDPHESMAAATVSIHYYKEMAKRFPNMDDGKRTKAAKETMEYVQSMPMPLDMKIDYLQRVASGKNPKRTAPEEIAAAQVLLNRYQRKMGIEETKF